MKLHFEPDPAWAVLVENDGVARYREEFAAEV